jgi:hypothetical protein
MFPPRPTALVHEILRDRIIPGELVIDATAGNGHDTVFLANCVGPGGTVLAFDVQEAAIMSARARVEGAGLAERVRFYHESHELMAERAAAGSAAAVMFNLGYLPGQDHQLTTQTAATLTALEAAAVVLQPGGALSIVCYPGHPAGAVEAVEIERWLLGCAEHGWRVAKYSSIATRKSAPFLLLAGVPS